MAPGPTGTDTSRLDELARIAGEQAGLRALGDKARAFRDRAIEVCERVVRDYDGRIASLEEQARALRAAARADLATLTERHEEARRTVEKTRVEQQEVDFRYEIGEISKADYPARRKAVDDRLASAEEEFDAVEALKRRFTEALKEDDALQASVPVTTGQPDAPPGDPVRAAQSAEGPPTRAPMPAAPNERAGLPDLESAPPTIPAARRGETMTFLPTPNPVFPPSRVPDSKPAAGPATQRADVSRRPPVAATPPGPVAVDQGSTVSIAPAVLREELAGGGEGAAHQLGFLTTIGRTPDNHISVTEAEVSRHHARIALTDKGFVIEDLRSGNGTFLNGDRIGGERLLKDQDRVRIGNRTFVFRVQ